MATSINTSLYSLCCKLAISDSAILKSILLKSKIPSSILKNLLAKSLLFDHFNCVKLIVLHWPLECLCVKEIASYNSKIDSEFHSSPEFFYLNFFKREEYFPSCLLYAFYLISKESKTVTSSLRTLDLSGIVITNQSTYHMLCELLRDKKKETNSHNISYSLYIDAYCESEDATRALISLLKLSQESSSFLKLHIRKLMLNSSRITQIKRCIYSIDPSILTSLSLELVDLSGTVFNQLKFNYVDFHPSIYSTPGFDSLVELRFNSNRIDLKRNSDEASLLSSVIASFPSLHSLDLGNNRLTSNLKVLLTSLNRPLLNLKLNACCLSHSDLHAIADSSFATCQLLTLNLSDNQNIFLLDHKAQNDPILRISTSCGATLLSLEIEDCLMVACAQTDRLKNILRPLKSLQQLNIRNNYQMEWRSSEDDKTLTLREALKQIAECLPRLQVAAVTPPIFSQTYLEDFKYEDLYLQDVMDKFCEIHSRPTIKLSLERMRSLSDDLFEW